MSNIDQLRIEAAQAQDAIRTHLRAGKTTQALVAAERLVAVLTEIETAERRQMAQGVTDTKRHRSHAPQINPASPVKACLDAGVKRLTDTAEISYGPQPAPNNYRIYKGSMKSFFDQAAAVAEERNAAEQAPINTEREQAVMIAPSLKASGEKYSGIDI